MAANSLGQLMIDSTSVCHICDRDLRITSRHRARAVCSILLSLRKISPANSVLLSFYRLFLQSCKRILVVCDCEDAAAGSLNTVGHTDHTAVGRPVCYTGIFLPCIAVSFNHGAVWDQPVHSRTDRTGQICIQLSCISRDDRICLCASMIMQ